MLTRNRLLYFWCVLTVGVVLVSALPGSGWINSFLAPYDSNRWAHFLLYASVATIPVDALKRRSIILLSLIPAMTGVSFELWQPYIPGTMVRPQNPSADLFGIAAGILLGLNFRMMRNSAKYFENPSSDTSSSSLH